LYSAATVSEGTPSNINSDIPDGEYAAIVEDVTLTQGSTARATIVWTFRICGGGHADRLLRKVRPISERTIAWVKEDLMKCGLKLNMFSDLSIRIDEMRGARVPVLKRGDNDFGVHIQWPKKAQPHSGEEIPF
jgi:hypothetical protein